jgi:hypothetical protein
MMYDMRDIIPRDEVNTSWDQVEFLSMSRRCDIARSHKDILHKEDGVFFHIPARKHLSTPSFTPNRGLASSKNGPHQQPEQKTA